MCSWFNVSVFALGAGTPQKPQQVDSHADGINFNEFIAAMFDAQKLAQAEVAKLVSCWSTLMSGVGAQLLLLLVEAPGVAAAGSLSHMCPAFHALNSHSPATCLCIPATCCCSCATIIQIPSHSLSVSLRSWMSTTTASSLQRTWWQQAGRHQQAAATRRDWQVRQALRL